MKLIGRWILILLLHFFGQILLGAKALVLAAVYYVFFQSESGTILGVISLGIEVILFPLYFGLVYQWFIQSSFGWISPHWFRNTILGTLVGILVFAPFYFLGILPYEVATPFYLLAFAAIGMSVGQSLLMQQNGIAGAWMWAVNYVPSAVLLITLFFFARTINPFVVTSNLLMIGLLGLPSLSATYIFSALKAEKPEVTV